jgi:hypothetical protein
MLHGQVFDRDQVDARRLAAVHGKEVDLADVRLGGHLGMRVVVVAARRPKLDGSAEQAAGLALDPAQLAVPLDHEVVPRVLAEREQDPVPGLAKRDHDREGRPIADVFRMLADVVSLAYRSDGTMCVAPE